MVFTLMFSPAMAQQKSKEKVVVNSNCFPSSELIKSLKEKKFIPVITGEVGPEIPVYGFFSPESNVMLYVTIKINTETKTEEMACISLVIVNYEMRGLGQRT